MACTLQTDSDQWLALMGANPALRDCIAEVFGIIDLQITPDILAEIDALIAELNAYLSRLQISLADLLGEIACVDLIISSLSSLPPLQQTPETIALTTDMAARKVVLDAQKIELQATLAPGALPLQIANTVALKEEMLCQKANATFFKSLTG